MSMTMTEAAAARIAEILKEADPRDHRFFRVMIEGGGCMGFQYMMDVDDAPMEGDVVIEKGDAKLVVDGFSAAFLNGAELDWVEDLAGARFEVRNPNAASSCGCGTSFTT